MNSIYFGEHQHINKPWNYDPPQYEGQVNIETTEEGPAVFHGVYRIGIPRSGKAAIGLYWIRSFYTSKSAFLEKIRLSVELSRGVEQ